MTKPTTLPALLASMGTTSNQVASWLRERGYRGNKGCNSYCPIANAVRSELGAQFVSVRLSDCCVETERTNSTLRPNKKGSEPVKMPDAVMSFVIDFDSTSNFDDLCNEVSE